MTSSAAKEGTGKRKRVATRRYGKRGDFWVAADFYDALIGAAVPFGEANAASIN